MWMRRIRINSTALRSTHCRYVLISRAARDAYNMIQLKESAQETEKTHEEIFRDRQHQVNAVYDFYDDE